MNQDLDYIKYRVSNSNNSDAGSFHRDIHTYNKTQPIYTCLAYLDESILEIIQISHKDLCIPYLDFYKSFKSKIQLRLRPGDLLLFNSSLLHRAIFFKNNTNNRRLIQLFNCVSVKNIIEFEKSILHIRCRDKCWESISNFLIKIYKKKNTSNLLNKIALLPSFRGYGYRCNTVYFIRHKDKEIKYISTEAETSRPTKNIYDNKFHKSNTYNMNKYRYKDIDENRRKLYKFFTFDIEYIIFFLLLIVICVILYLLIKISFKFKKNLLKK